MFLLKRMPGFSRFMKFNELNDEHLKLSAFYLQHQHFPKGSYIFKQGEQSKRFYGIIKGRISLRIRIANIVVNNETDNKPKKNATYTVFKKIMTSFLKVKTESLNKSANNIPTVSEKEIMILNAGMCFGEWALIYDIPRTASAYTLEDTDVFYLDKECFDMIFSKGIAKADSEKKNFIVKQIPSLKLVGKTHDLLKKIVPIFCDNKKIIYTELDKPEFLYLVYQGECHLQKMYYEKKSKSVDEITRNQERMIIFSKLNKGAIAGLELVTNCPTYSYNLICSKDQTILYKISLKMLTEINKDVIEYLTPIYEEQNTFLKKFVQNHERQAKKMKINFRETFKSSEKLISSQLENKISDKIIKKNAKKKIENANNILKTPMSNFKFNKVEVTKKEQGYFTELKVAQYKKRRGALLKVGTVKNFADLMKNYLSNKQMNETVPTPTFKEGILITTFGKRKSNLILPSAKGSLKENVMPRVIIPESFFKKIEEKSENINKEIPTLENVSTFYNTARIKKIPNLKIQNDEENTKRKETTNRMIQPSCKTSRNGYKLSEHLSSTLSLWNKTREESLSNYDSGAFNLPLLSLYKTK